MFNTIYIMFLAYGFMHSVISVCVMLCTLVLLPILLEVSINKITRISA